MSINLKTTKFPTFKIKFTIKDKFFFFEPITNIFDTKAVGMLSNPFHNLLSVFHFVVILENNMRRFEYGFLKDKLDIGWYRRSILFQLNLITRYAFCYLPHVIACSFYYSGSPPNPGLRGTNQRSS